MLYDLGELTFFVHKIRVGAVPGLDYVVNAYGPGRYWLIAALSALFGERLDLIWLVFVALRLGISAAAFELGGRLIQGRWALMPPLALILLPGPLHKGFYLLGTLLLALAALRWLREPGREAALTFGICTALVGLFRLDLGAFGALLFFVLWLRSSQRARPRQLLAAWSPPLLMLLGLALFCLARGDGVLPAVLRQMGDDVFKNQTIRWPAFPGMADLFGAKALHAWALWLPAPIYAALAWLLVRVHRGADEGQPRGRVLVILLLGVLTLNQVRMKPELGHLLQATPMLYCASLLILDRSRVGGRGARILGLFAALILPTLLLANTLVFHAGSLYSGAFTIAQGRVHRVETALGPAWLNSGERDQLQPLLSYLRDEAPPGPIWVPTNQPLYYALSGREDVVGVVGVVYYAENSRRQQQVIERLRAHRPPVIVFVDDSIEGPERMLGHAAPSVLAWLFANYRQERRIGTNRILVPKP